MGSVEPFKREDGAWMVPVESDEDGTQGFTFLPLNREHPEYLEWVEYIRSTMPAGWASAVSGRLPG